MTANIYLGDNQAAFDSGKKWDLAIVDPPYGIGRDGEGDGSETLSKHRWKQHKIKKWDKSSPDKKYFDLLLKCSTNQIIWGANHFISKIPIDSKCWVMWDKIQEFSLADFELAWTSFTSPCRSFRFSRGAATNEKKGNALHPTQKPVALYKWLLKNYAKEGDTILDTHGGSMSSVIACIDMGFDIDVWELDPDYYAAAKKRILNHVQQLPLFGTPPIINFYE